MEIISDFQESVKNNANIFHIQDFSNIILSHLLYHIIYFPKHFKVSFRQNTPLPLNASILFPKIKYSYTYFSCQN